MIRVENLVKTYGSTTAVDHLDFAVKPGQITGFLGPNGAGKSTTMRMMLGLDRPDSGHVFINGKAYRDYAAPIHEVGALLDAKAVFGKRSARKHLTWIAQAGGVDPKRVHDVLEMVGLTSVASKHVGEFSLGMSQRLGIASALLGDPPVLLFDEPVNGLDPEGIRWFRRLMKQLANEGRTILVSSHLMSEMQATADHVIVIGKGKLVADAPIDHIVNGTGANRVRFRSSHLPKFRNVLEAEGASITQESDSIAMISGLDPQAIGELAFRHQVPVHELAQQTQTLEDAYMELTQESVEFQAQSA